MTKNQLKKKITTLLYRNKKEFQKRIDRALDSGAYDITAYEDNFLLPKIIITAVYAEMSRQYLPFNKADRETAKNIELFL